MFVLRIWPVRSLNSAFTTIFCGKTRRNFSAIERVKWHVYYMDDMWMKGHVYNMDEVARVLYG